MIAVGDAAERDVLVDDARIRAFGDASGDENPLHFDDAYAAGTPFGGRIAHGLLTASFVSALIATELPGPGSVYLGQSLRFRAPVRPGDVVRVRVEVTAVDERRRRATLATTCAVAGKVVLDGEATVMLPA